MVFIEYASSGYLLESFQKWRIESFKEQTELSPVTLEDWRLMPLCTCMSVFK